MPDAVTRVILHLHLLSRAEVLPPVRSVAVKVISFPENSALNAAAFRPPQRSTFCARLIAQSEKKAVSECGGGVVCQLDRYFFRAQIFVIARRTAEQPSRRRRRRAELASVWFGSEPKPRFFPSVILC